MSQSWTDERIDRLKALWGQGKTASHIAEELGGVSRNAVIGKAHRLGLQSRPSPVKANEPAPKAKARPKERIGSAAPTAPAPRAVAEASPPFDEGDDIASAESARGTAEPAAPTAPAGPPPPVVRSIGPGGFVRQGPSDQQAPIPPAPPRRLVPAKPSPEVADKTGLLDLNERICKWPIGHPGEPDFHFCGRNANPGFPYCVEHCGVAYQAQLPRRDRKPPPPLPFGGPRVR